MTGENPNKPGFYTYLGIDPGVANCALVAFRPDRGVVLAWKPQKKEIPRGVQRLSYLMHAIKLQLDVVAKQGEIRRIAMEGYSMLEKFGQHAAGEVGGAIKLTFVGWFGLDNPTGYPILVAPQQLKKFAMGNGNARKAMMPKEVFKRWGEDFNDENLADAYALARVAYAVDVAPAMTNFQTEVVKALQGRTEWDPSWRQKTVRKTVFTKPSSSRSLKPPTPADLPSSSVTPSVKARTSNSGPSGRWQLTRPSRRRRSVSASSPPMT